MAAEKTKGDALRIYLTGAASDGGAQADPAASLGGHRSSTELVQLVPQGAVASITIEQASAGLGVGDASIESDGAGNLRFSKPGDGESGVYVEVGDTERKVLLDAAGVEHLRVYRSGSAPAAGNTVLPLVERLNALWSNVADAERAAGSGKYRALMLKNQSSSPLIVRIYLGLLGTARILNAGGYAASGAVTITITTGTLNDWPKRGFVENQDTGEVLYYQSRTENALSVPAGGRDVFSEVSGGSSGLSGHVLYPIPGLRLAKETPVANAIQVIPVEGTAPSGVVWRHPVHGGDAEVLEELFLPAGNLIGLWLHRKIVAGQVADPWTQVRAVVEIWSDP